MRREWFNSQKNGYYYYELYEDKIGGSWFILRFEGDNEKSKYKKLIFFNSKKEALKNMEEIDQRLENKGYKRIR